MNKTGIRGKLALALHWPVLLLPLLMVMTVVVGMVNPYACMICGIVDVFYVLFLLWWYLYWKKQLDVELAEFAEDFQGTQMEQLLELPLPYALLGEEGEVLWVNRAFEAILPAQEESFDIYRMIPSLKGELPQPGTCFEDHIEWGGLAYRAEVQIASGNGGMYSLFLFDETSHLQTLQELEDSRAVVGQIYIDNYEEVISGADQVRQTLLAALVERKISKYFSRYDALIRRMERDKFSVFMQRKGLRAVMEDRFSILEDVKNNKAPGGGESSFTLSISMAADGETLTEISESARNTMNLALGRGGDQAIVRTAAGNEFYGGKTQHQETGTRVKARVKAEAMRELMTQRDQVLIMGHHLPDMDCFGAAVGIYRAAATLGKTAHIVMDEVTSSLRPLVNRFKESPDYPDDMIINSEKAKALLDANTMVVVVDVNRPSYTECPQLIDRASTIVVLDHHRQGGESIRKATLSYIEPYASSASEMVAEVLQYFGVSMKIRPIEAETIYAGIVMDTDNFLAKTGVRTFEAAAFLRRHGADVSRVRKLFREKMEDTRVKAATVSNAEIFMDAYAFAECHGKDVESPTVIGAQAANDLLDIVGVKASFVFTEHNDKIYISARSIDEVNVQMIMEKLGGGGHMGIAGAQIADSSVREAMEKVKDTLRQMVKDGSL